MHFLLLLAACRNDPDLTEDPRSCERYLACAAVADEWNVDEHRDVYGPDGTCWSTTPSQCATECEDAFDALPYVEDAACDGKVPSADCAVMFDHLTLCPALQDQTVPLTCGNQPEYEECMADAIEECPPEIDNAALACAFLRN